jgi:hypothetical protein
MLEIWGWFYIQFGLLGEKLMYLHPPTSRAGAGEIGGVHKISLIHSFLNLNFAEPYDGCI